MNWEPFEVAPPGVRSEAPRSISTPEGIGDRLRAAAFAEIQAREAFLWAADYFTDAPTDLREAWKRLAHAEDRHLNWLLHRMVELGVEIKARMVSEQLWISLRSCKNAKDFALYMASAEERGRRAGCRFHEALGRTDPETAGIFGKIAEEEVQHIALAKKYYPE